MESESQTSRPESPKKKLKSSAVDSEVTCLNESELSKNSKDKTKSDHADGPSVNGVPELSAPSRKGRTSSTVDSSSENNEIFPSSENDNQSIQEEIVSSSENAVCELTPEYDAGDADSISYEPEEPSPDEKFDDAQ